MSTLRGRFDNVTLRFCGLLLGFVGDCRITLSAVVAMLVHPGWTLSCCGLLQGFVSDCTIRFCG